MNPRWVSILFAVGVLLASVPCALHADPAGTAFTYQGQLRVSGLPVDDTCDLEFTLYDDLSAGSVVSGPLLADDWPVINGLFTVPLDFGEDCFTGDARWLEVAVQCSGDAEFTTLSPRQELTPVPYALALPALRTEAGPDSPNVIGGYSGNLVADGLSGATIGGGGEEDPGGLHEIAGAGNFGTIGGGRSNYVSGYYGTVAGGAYNRAEDTRATVGGGDENYATADNATIAGGRINRATANNATVGGGYDNHATGQYATIPGGYANYATGDYSFAAGRQAQAGHNGAFVWADSTGAAFSSTGIDQFLIRATGGVGINTSDPQAALHVGGTPDVDGIMFPDGTLQTTAATGGNDWSLSGNAGTTPGTDFLGTTDDVALEVHVNSLRALRIEPDDVSPNIVGGYYGNSVDAGVAGATIAGGGSSDWGGSAEPNSVSGSYGTVSGGFGNRVSGFRGNTVAGGQLNIASGSYCSTIGGGDRNEASGSYSTIGGGDFHVASGTDSTVGGGQGNEASAFAATVAGGRINTASGEQSTVSGGGGNNSTGAWATVGGGWFNDAISDRTTISGGTNNEAAALGAVVGGGVENNATGGYSTVGGGFDNTASGYQSTVSGGVSNTAYDDQSTVGGGFGNTASGERCTVGGGDSNFASDYASTIGGGYSNEATNTASTVGGGLGNNASGYQSTVGGGAGNTASHIQSTVGGGDGNIASGDKSTVGGGYYNTASGSYSAIGGGGSNTASDETSTVGGGWGNTASANGSTVGGGANNDATGIAGTIAGGSSNDAAGAFSSVPGGWLNSAGGYYSFTAGLRAKVRDGDPASDYYSGDDDGDEGTFIWADSTDEDFISTGPDQFLVRASGGVGINTNTPSNDLTVAGDADFTGSVGIGLSSTPYGKLMVRQTSDTEDGGFAVQGSDTRSVRLWIDPDNLTAHLDCSSGGDGPLVINRGGGNVGIGTETPEEQLHVYISHGDGDAIYGSAESNIVGHEHSGVHGEAAGNGGTNYGVRGDAWSAGPGSNYGVYGNASGPYTATGVYGYAAVTALGTAYGVRAEAHPGTQGSAYAGYFTGDVEVTGTLSKGGGSFKIDHPLDPENKYLYHSFVESPDMMNVYNGNVVTDEQGFAEVILPEWFETINRDFRYQLTAIGQFAQAIIGAKVQDNRFTILTDKPNVEVSWQITGIRQDPWANANRIPVEEGKPEAEIGSYLHPDLYGQPESKRVDLWLDPSRLEELEDMTEQEAGATTEEGVDDGELVDEESVLGAAAANRG